MHSKADSYGRILGISWGPTNATQLPWLFLFCIAAVIAAPAQSIFFTTLASFDGNPNGLIQANDGNFYGTAELGGAYGYGWVFKITPAGTVTSVYSFDGLDGRFPTAGLVQASDGNFYGTTQWGGTDSPCDGLPGCGTIFKVTPSGVLTTLYRFCSQNNCADGKHPAASVIEASDGNFYGTTLSGGGGSISNGYGTIFKITAEGALTTLHSFDFRHGSNPSAALVQASDGNFYGTTYNTVFKITPSGMLTTLAYTEGGANGLVQANDGNFYGTTNMGGVAGDSGTVFRITASGELTTLYLFCSETNCADGKRPAASLIEANDGNFYGTTTEGGAYDYCTNGCGSVFKITPSGVLSTLHSFCASGWPCTDDWDPSAALVQAKDWSFYGTTINTVFRVGVVRTCATCRP